MRIYKKLCVGSRCERWLLLEPGPIVFHGKGRTPFKTWVCECDCGTVKVVLENSLRKRRSKSCGCLRGDLLRATVHRLWKHADESANWKGGRVRTAKGYVQAYVDKGDPFFSMASAFTTSGNGYVPEHRLVMARYLGRPLTEDEEVHHVNGKRDENGIENLQLRIKHHGAGSAFRCLDCGSHNVKAVPLK